MPRFTPAELSLLLDCQPSELPERAAALVRGTTPALVRRILELRGRAAELEPPPTREELCLGLLALLALEGGG